MTKGTVCVTGAGGYIGSWLVKLLLSKGYIVHGTIRDPTDKKLVHFDKFENASNLRLFKADVLDLESLRSAIEGCDGVEVIGPAVNGTRNVLKACSEAKVKRVVYLSSLGAVLYNPGWPDDKMMDEDPWSDKELCRQTQGWYVLAKTEAESLALDYGKKNGLDVVSVCPGGVLGPFLLHPVHGYNRILIDFARGEKTVFGIFTDNLNLVDVRDTADAILLAYEKPRQKFRRSEREDRKLQEAGSARLDLQATGRNSPRFNRELPSHRGAVMLGRQTSLCSPLVLRIISLLHKRSRSVLYTYQQAQQHDC